MADEKKAVAVNDSAKAQKARASKKPNIFSRFFKYLKEVKSEIKKVTWPTPKQVVRDTLTVIIIVVICAVFIGVIDIIFKGAVNLSIGEGLANLFS